jgi:hypothetical protein
VAWCRFRVVIPVLDRTQASVQAACDAAFRRLGGVPAYLLTGNEKTVTAGHVAGIPVRNPGAVADCPRVSKGRQDAERICRIHVAFKAARPPAKRGRAAWG